MGYKNQYKKPQKHFKTYITTKINYEDYKDRDESMVKY